MGASLSTVPLSPSGYIQVTIGPWPLVDRTDTSGAFEPRGTVCLGWTKSEVPLAGLRMWGEQAERMMAPQPMLSQPCTLPGYRQTATWARVPPGASGAEDGWSLHALLSVRFLQASKSLWPHAQAPPARHTVRVRSAHCRWTSAPDAQPLGRCLLILWMLCAYKSELQLSKRLSLDQKPMAKLDPVFCLCHSGKHSLHPPLGRAMQV